MDRQMMQIRDLFDREINRPINGVVKADQLDQATVWQELDEFVVTRELDSHLRRFFDTCLAGMDHQGDAETSDRIGIWISGFFGSGKSHFIKVLRYLLRDEPISANGDTKRPVEFFEHKIDDSMLLGDIRRAVASDTDVILFNIDARASHRSGRDAVLQVFLKVFNELQGYSGDHPHIAHMERYLDSKGKLTIFQDAFRQASGSDWKDERDAYEFHRDETVEAFCAATGQSQETAKQWVDNAENNFELTVEAFAGWVRDYLDAHGRDRRIVFIVDEVGQFVGDDTHLMLNLQTIAEQLGTVCAGRAWLVVTSQEDIDAVLGEMRKTKPHDFSKIQGRFRTRMSLSSANVDEVIQSRLLTKQEPAAAELQSLFAEKGEIAKNQLTFSGVGMTMRGYADADDFVANYPFAPYQFLLVQKIFEAIRKVGAAGLNLSRGERSTLDAFQSAAKQILDQEIGVLVPLYRFYPAIESFLDTAVKRTIDQAKDRGLSDFDVDLLKVLFLIRYVDEIKGSVDNLVTLCIDAIDADRFALRRRVEASLARLEEQTLISRSGDVYAFLTNEERDISREIKQVELTGAEEAKLLGDLVFDDAWRDKRKHRYSGNKMDFTLNRSCDGHPVGNQQQGGLPITVISPLNEDYPLYESDEKCKLESHTEDGQAIFRLADHEALARELRVYKQTDKYVSTKHDADTEQTRRILRGFAEENRERRARLVSLLGELLAEADVFVAGQDLKPDASAASNVLDEAVEYLIRNTFTRMNLVKQLHSDPLREIQAVLRTNDIGQLQLDLRAEDGNALALDDLREYIELSSKADRRIVLHELIEGRYAVRPYGWPPLETALLVAQLLALGEITLVAGGGPISLSRAYDPLTTRAKWRGITVVQKKQSDPQALQKARGLGKDVFSEMGPDGEEPLFEFLQAKLREWQTNLSSWKRLADTDDDPGRKEIEEGLALITPLLSESESFRFIERFNALKADLLDLSEDYRELDQFYTHQRTKWVALRKAHARFASNRLELERDEKAAGALRRMEEIFAAQAPYGMIKEVDELIAAVDAVNNDLVSHRRTAAITAVDDRAKAVEVELQAVKADEPLRRSCMSPMDRLREVVVQTQDLARLAQAEAEANHLFDTAVDQIQVWLRRQQEKKGGGKTPPPAVKPLTVIRPAESATGDYIESDADIDAFLDRLRASLTQAIKDGNRVRIR